MTSDQAPATPATTPATPAQPQTEEQRRAAIEHELGAFEETALTEEDARQSELHPYGFKPEEHFAPYFMDKEDEKGQEIHLPTSVTTKTARELFGLQPGETVSQAIARTNARTNAKG